MIKILDRYIITRFLTSFFFTILMLLAISVVIDFTEKNEKYNKANLDAAQILDYYLDFIPWIANLITPIMVFIAVVFVTHRMASHTEIVAILSSGVSFNRLLRPFLIGGTSVALLSFWLTGWVIPNSNKDRVAFEVAYLERPYTFSERNFHVKIGPGTYLYLESYSNRNNLGYKVSIEKIEGLRLVSKLSGQRLEWNEEEEKWTIKQWQLREFVEDDGVRLADPDEPIALGEPEAVASPTERKEVVTFGDRIDTTLSLSPKDFDNDYRQFETLTMNELEDVIQRLNERGADDIESYYIERQFRFASPVAVIVLTFIGVLVSARKRRGGTGYVILVGFLLMFALLLSFIFTRSLAQAGSMDITLAVWLPIAIFVGIGLLIYRRLPK